MIRRVFTLVGFVFAAFVFFFVPIEKRTLFEHTRRILKTKEAQELQEELKRGAEKSVDELQEEINIRYPEAKKKADNSVSVVQDTLRQSGKSRRKQADQEVDEMTGALSDENNPIKD